MKRILIAGANPYNANKGVAALSVAAIKIIHDILSAQKEDYEICLYNHEFKLTYDSIETADGTIPFQNIYPTELFSWRKLFSTISSRWRLYNLKEFLKADFVFSLSAGDGFSDIYGEDSFSSLTGILRLCRLFGKPYYLLPQTFGPFFNETVRKRALRDCKHAAGLMARDTTSYRFVRNELGVHQITNSIDVAFCLPYRPTKQNDSYKHIGINISQTLCFKEKKQHFSVASSYLQTMKDLIISLLNDGYKIHLIPHVASTANNNTNEYYIAYRLWTEVSHPNLILAPFFLSPSDAKGYISSMDLFVGARMHACIAAFSSGVPVLLLGYSRKFSGLFLETLNYPYLMDVADNLTVDQLLLRIKEMMASLDEIKSEIEDCLHTIVKKKVKELYDTLSDILS